MRGSVQYIAGFLLSSHLGDPSGARGQAIGLLAQTLAQRAVAAGHGEVLIALGAMLCGVLASILLSRHGNRRGGHSVRPTGSGLAGGGSAGRGRARSAGSHADPLAATIPAWFQPSGRAVPPGFGVPSGRAVMLPLAGSQPMLWLAGRHAAFRYAVALAMGLAASSASATPEASPVGTWSTANGHGVVAIDRCGDALCGRIVGIERKPTEPMPTDVDGRPQCGLTIITNERPQPDGTWLGHIKDPRDGGVYQAKLWLDARGNLRLRGFIGIPALGATQTWHRFTGQLTAACGLA